MTHPSFPSPHGRTSVEGEPRGNPRLPQAFLLATLILLSSVPMEVQAQEPRVIGFLEVPQLFAGWTTEWERIPPDPDFELLLRTGPSPGSDVVSRVPSRDMLDAVEFEYEVLGARVFGRSGDWSLLRTAEGETGWAEPMEGARFHPLEDRLLDGLTYLTPVFEGFLAPTPGGTERIQVPADPRRTIVGTLEPRTWRKQVVVQPGEDPQAVHQRYRASASSLSRPRSDGTRVMTVEVGSTHPLYESPHRSAERVGEVETSRADWAVFTARGSGVQGRVLVFDTRPGWFQVALEEADWRRASRAWLEKDPDWTFHPTASAEDARELADRSFGRRFEAVRVLEFRRVDEDLWARVEVLSDSPCFTREEPDVVARGWIPVHSTSGAPNVWFFARGC